MTIVNDVYLKLSERLGAPGSTRFAKALAAMLTSYLQIGNKKYIEGGL